MSLIGEQLAGEYELVEALGHGATSVVYKSVRITDGKVFAIKLLHAHLVKKEGTLKRFEQEARAAMLLCHPNIIKVNAINKTADGQPFLIMDYVQGENLGEMLSSSALELQRIWKFFIQIADAMNHAHLHGVVHRSLKPSNIIVTGCGTENEQAMVSDFGLAKLLPSSGQEIQDLTVKGAVIGSPLYMSPEQCLGREITERADIYSMGCLMYACISGKPPLKGEHIIETMSKHVSEIPLTFDRVCPERKIPEAVQSIVFTCMAKRPEDRYQSMDLLKQDLIAFQEGRVPQTLLGPQPLLNAAAGEKPATGEESHLKKILLAVLALLVAVSIYAGWKASQHKAPEVPARSPRPAPLRKTHAIHPISSLALLKQADQLSQMNRDQQAKALYREVIQRASDRVHDQSVDNEALATAHFGLARLYRKIYQWNEAEKEIRIALYVEGLCGPGAAPGKDLLRQDLADCLLQQGKLKECRQMLLTLKKETKDVLAGTNADLMLAELSRRSGKTSEAEEYELSALASLKGQRGFARRQYCLVLARYANHLIERKQFARAVDSLKEGLKERPVEDWDDWDAPAAVFLTVELARALACTKDYPAAVAACRSMLDTFESSRLSLKKSGARSADIGILTETTAVILCLSGDAEAAGARLADSLSLQGPRLGRVATMVRILIYSDQTEEALALLSRYKNEAFKQPERKAEFHALRALALGKQKKNQEALGEVDRAISIVKSSNQDLLYRYCLQLKAQVLRQMNRADAAALIEKTTGRTEGATADFDFLLPAYQRLEF